MSDSLTDPSPDTHNFLGWHGTTMKDLAAMHAEGVKVQKNGNFDGYSQWGEGFYVTVRKQDCAVYAKRRTGKLKEGGENGDIRSVAVPIFLPNNAPIRILSISGSSDRFGAVNRKEIDFRQAQPVTTSEWKELAENAEVREKDLKVTDFSGFDSGSKVINSKTQQFDRIKMLYTAIGGTVKDSLDGRFVYQIMLREMVLGYVKFGTAEILN